MDLRTSFPAAAVVFGCTVLVAVRVASAPGPTPRRAATPDEIADIASSIAASERDWTLQTTQNFPADRWSQRDDFHGRELARIEEIVKEKGIRVEDVLRAIDDDLHRRPASATTIPGSKEDRHADAVPCKPRPFYD